MGHLCFMPSSDRKDDLVTKTAYLYSTSCYDFKAIVYLILKFDLRCFPIVKGVYIKSMLERDTNVNAYQ
jgi:hypothetical protein